MMQVEEVRPEALLVDGWLPDLEVAEFSAQMMKMYPEMEVLGVDGSSLGQGSGGRCPRRNELLHALRMAHGAGSAAVSDAPPAAASTLAASSAPLRAGVEAAERTLRGAAPAGALPEMIGESAAMLELAGMIRLVAARSATVLIEGETGTGKEIVAKAIPSPEPESREELYGSQLRGDPGNAAGS